MMISVFERVENIVEKGENAGFPSIFTITIFFWAIKTQDCVAEG